MALMLQNLLSLMLISFFSLGLSAPLPGEMEKRSVLVILICVREGRYFEDEGLGGWVVHEDELQGLFVAESDALDGHVHRITFNATRYYRNYRHQAYSESPNTTTHQWR